MTKLELLAVLYSLDALHDGGQPEAAHKVIKRLIAEAEAVKGGNYDKT